MAKYRNTYHCYGLAIKADEMSLTRDFMGIQCLLLFNVGILSNAYRI